MIDTAQNVYSENPQHQASPFWNFRRNNPARTLIFCAAGAFIGLGIAGYGLFTASGTTTAVFPAEDAAIVNGVPILMADFISQLRSLYDVPLSEATLDQRHQVLDDMIREELYVQRGVELGMPSDDIEVRAALVAATEAQTASEALAGLPSDTELLTFYNNNPDKYSSEGTMSLTDWIVPKDVASEAASIAKKLREGAKPETLGLIKSADQDEQEQFYFAAKIHLGAPLFQAARQLMSGDISDPLTISDATHILVMKKNNFPVQQSFEKAKPRVVIDYTTLKKKQILEANSKFLSDRAHISIAPELK